MIPKPITFMWIILPCSGTVDTDYALLHYACMLFDGTMFKYPHTERQYGYQSKHY
jgi:hypothetical protein